MPEKVMLAKKYVDGKTNPVGWYMSHKIDGIRATWDGSKLLTRGGNEIFAPSWFLESLPEDFTLDGELVFAPDGNECGNFQQTCSVVKRHVPDDRWKNVMYFVFEFPSKDYTFDLIYDWAKERVTPPHIRVLEQVVCTSVEHMREYHDEYVGRGGEGIMLRNPDSKYEYKRSKNVLKVKIWDDAEATVIDHLPGQGKHEGRLGGAICNWTDGRNDRTFHVGVGWTDAERENPPPVGTIITFSYFGLTDAGSPRHPKYLRIREDYE